MYDKAVEEIIQIVMNNDGTIMRNLLSDFLKRFEENMIEANRESIEESFKENQEPMHNEGFD